ncbi:MAG: hypothetical protein ACREIC_19930 [Limisphaerales bacterium]
MPVNLPSAAATQPRAASRATFGRRPYAVFLLRRCLAASSRLDPRDFEKPEELELTRAAYKKARAQKANLYQYQLNLGADRRPFVNVAGNAPTASLKRSTAPQIKSRKAKAKVA